MMKSTVMFLFIFLTFMKVYLINAKTKSILIDNEEYICTNTFDENTQSNNQPIQAIHSKNTGCKYNSHNGYKFFNGSFFSGYYKYHREAELWVDARKICESECAYLAIPNSKEEADFIYSLHKAHPVGHVTYPCDVLIGFDDIVKEGNYITSLGTSLSTTGFTTWLPGHPNNGVGGNEDCGSLCNSVLNDFPCPVPSPFMCEKDNV